MEHVKNCHVEAGTQQPIRYVLICVREKNRNEARAAKKWAIINGAPVAARPGAVWAVLYRLTAFNQACVSTIVRVSVEPISPFAFPRDVPCHQNGVIALNHGEGLPRSTCSCHSHRSRFDRPGG